MKAKSNAASIFNRLILIDVPSLFVHLPFSSLLLFYLIQVTKTAFWYKQHVFWYNNTGSVCRASEWSDREGYKWKKIWTPRHWRMSCWMWWQDIWNRVKGDDIISSRVNGIFSAKHLYIPEIFVWSSWNCQIQQKAQFQKLAVLIQTAFHRLFLFCIRW